MGTLARAGCLVALLALWTLVLCLVLAPWKRRPGPPRGVGVLELDGQAMRLEVLCEDPLVRVVHNFVGPAEAEELITRYAHLLAPSTVSSNTNHLETSLSQHRVSSTAYLPQGSDEHAVIRRVENRAVFLSGKPLKNLETLQLLRYEGSGQYYKKHFDYFHDNPRSQRTTTIFLYLNDTQGQGATHFPRLDLLVRPERGKACIWENCRLVDREMVCDERLEHAGLPLESPELTKHGLNIWFRSGAYR
jgi:prolyl 4-hydroxylase